MRAIYQFGKILAALAVAATLVTFIDTYFLKSKLAAALRLPPELPTGLFLIVIFAFLGAILVLIVMLTVAWLAISTIRKGYEYSGIC